MGGPIYYAITYAVQEGKEEAHAEECKKFVVSADKEDAGTLLYYFSEDPANKRKWTLREVHKDEAALFAHVGRVGTLLGDWLGTVDGGKWDSVTVVGDYSDAVVEAFKGFAPFVKAGEDGIIFVKNGDGLGMTHAAA